MAAFSNLPPVYGWLGTIAPLPLMIRNALALLGVVETPGAGDNPVILGWAQELGTDFARHYCADSIPWCGLFMAVVAKRAGKPIPAHPLWALSWAQFGQASERPALGDTLVFRRDGGGHVGLYVGEDDHAFHVLGGNQGDRVGFARIARARLYAARQPVYRVRPTNAVPLRLAAAGGLSASEA